MKRTSNNKGQSMVELALSLTFLFIMTLGVIDFARIFSTYQRMVSVGRESGRIFVKSNINTATTNTTVLRDGPEGVKIKVYDVIVNTMKPDKLDREGSVIISVLRRVDNVLLATTSDTPLQRETAESDDQLQLVHRFTFDSTPATGFTQSKINQVMDGTKIIVSGPSGSTLTPVVTTPVISVNTVRLGEELIVVEMYYKNDMITGIDKLFSALALDRLYDRTIF
jgi:Flp pilus assembly protein TadG